MMDVGVGYDVCVMYCYWNAATGTVCLVAVFGSACSVCDDLVLGVTDDDLGFIVFIVTIVSAEWVRV